MEVDKTGLEVLDRATCLDLLRTATVGRIGISSRAMPTILPVAFLVVDGEVVIRTGAGSKLDAATRNAVVAFEVDDIDVETRTGWSVAATGVAREVPAAELAGLDLTRLQRWVPRGDGRVIAITLDVLTGRRLPGADGPAGDRNPAQ